jgi:short-subunit dehydrogenase
MSNIRNKIVVITGGSSGIGAILAEKVILHGGTPILVARSEEKLRGVAGLIKSKYQMDVPYYIADVSNLNKVESVFQEILTTYSTVDILVNNAGYGIFQSFMDAPIYEFEEMMRVNYFGVVYCTKQALPSMIKMNKGHIINIASQAGKIGTPKSTAYSATKHALLGFTNSLRLEMKEHNIDVTSVNPGPIRTAFFDLADQSGQYTKNIAKYMLEPEYVADRIVRVMIKPQRELNLPQWMDMGSRLFHLFPNTMDRLVRGLLNKK